MRIVLIFYTDFVPFTSKGKSEELYYTLCSLKKNVKNVMVRGKKNEIDKFFPMMKIMVPPGRSIIPRFFVAIEKYVFSQFPSRLLGEMWFDFWVSKRLSKDGKFIYTVPRLTRTFEKAKEMGYKIICHSGELHPDYNYKLVTEEYKKLGIKFRNPAWSKTMFKKYKKTLNLSDYIIVHSEYAKRNYVEYGIPENKIKVIPLGVDIDKFKNLKRKLYWKQPFTFLFVGNVSVIKGIRYLLEAWKKLDLKDAKLIIAGAIHKDGKEIIKKLSPLKNVELVGYVNVKEVFSKSDVFVFPSLSENPGKVVFEAMAAGLPVIATEPAAHPVRDKIDGFVIPIRNVNLIIDKMMYFYKNKEKTILMGENAKQWIRNFSWDNYIIMLRSFMEKVS